MINRALRQRARNKSIQERASMDERLTELEVFDAWRPLLTAMGHPDKYSGEEMARKLGKLGLLKLAQLTLDGKEKTQAFAAREIAHMGGLKPIEKSASINLNVMTEMEIDSMLESKLKELGLDKSGTNKDIKS